MSEYDIEIVNGAGSGKMEAGSYTVSVKEAHGYDTTSLSPTTFTATDEGATGTFTISASGALKFIVNETGAVGGTPVTGGTIIMTDSTGNTTYGDAVTIGTTGEADFANVPFGDTSEPYTLYFKQLTSDSTHKIYSNVISVNMTSNAQTEYVINEPYATQTFTLTDANYNGLPIANANLNFVK